MEKKKKNEAVASFFLAAELGFEPRQTESESVVLTVTLFGNVDFQRRLYYHILLRLSRENREKNERILFVVKTS